MGFHFIAVLVRWVLLCFMATALPHDEILRIVQCDGIYYIFNALTQELQPLVGIGKPILAFVDGNGIVSDADSIEFEPRWAHSFFAVHVYKNVDDSLVLKFREAGEIRNGRIPSYFSDFRILELDLTVLREVS